MTDRPLRAGAVKRPVPAGWEPGPPLRSRSAGGHIWMVTITDLILLLFAFFVMLFSMMTLDVPLTQRTFISDLLPMRAEAPITIETDPAHVEKNIRAVAPPRAFAAGYLARLLRDTVSQTPALAGLDVRLYGDLIVVKIPESLWKPDDAATAERAAALGVLAQFLGRLDTNVVVTGARFSGPDAAEAWSGGLIDAVSAANYLKTSGFLGSLNVQSRLAASRADEGVYLYIFGEGDGT